MSNSDYKYIQTNRIREAKIEALEVFYLILSLIIITIGWIAFNRPRVSQIKKRLNEYNVVITGGSSGIGLALAKLFYMNGANVTLIARDIDKLNAARKLIISDAGDISRVQIVSLDLTLSYEKLNEKLISLLAQKGSIDILINCAGYAVARSFVDTPVEVFENLIKTNYLSAVYVTRSLLPFMMHNNYPMRERRIAFICSMAGLVGIYGYSGYSASKYALRGFAEVLNMELGPEGVSVTLAFPPDTDTPGFDLENQGKPEATKEICASGGLASADDVAKTIFVDILDGKFVSSFGLEGNALSWVTAGLLPPVSLYVHSQMRLMCLVISSCLEVLAAGPLRLFAICYAFWIHSIPAKHSSTNVKRKLL